VRDDTAEWLEPLLKEANSQGIDTNELMGQAMMPFAESTLPADNLANVFGGKAGAIDWVQFGCLLRDRLGWEDTYPGPPIG
jgi:hypothetical protein